MGLLLVLIRSLISRATECALHRLPYLSKIIHSHDFSTLLQTELGSPNWVGSYNTLVRNLTPYLEIEPFRGNYIKMRSYVWALIQHDWCPYRERPSGHRGHQVTFENSALRTGARGWSLESSVGWRKKQNSSCWQAKGDTAGLCPQLEVSKRREFGEGFKHWAKGQGCW